MATSHAKKAAKFISDPERVTRHDQTFWGLREKRDIQAAMLPEWEDLREHASEIKEHTLTHLADYLDEFSKNLESNGVIVQVGQKMHKSLTKQHTAYWQTTA